MVELLSRSGSDAHLTVSELLAADEVVVIVDDSPEIVLLLKHYLERYNLPVCHAGTAHELYTLLDSKNIALVLLDIGLPDKNGNEILKDIGPRYPDLGIIMVTGTTDLQTALHCLRLGADDYLTKPVIPEQFNHVLHTTLKKRKLAIDNRRFQRELESTNYRTQFLHQLNLQMNKVYLSTVELKAILQAILVGITSAEGLKFNRAFLALCNDETQMLEGRLAIGNTCRDQARKVWDSIRENNLHLKEIISSAQQTDLETDAEVNEIVQHLQVPITDEGHLLVATAHQKKTMIVDRGNVPGYVVPDTLKELLNHDTFVIVPLYSPSKSLGVIIVDNFVTGKKISQDDIHALEIFASQASLAIEHSHLYQEMDDKIEELELVTQELEKNKDLLVAAEKYSALGHMSAQLAHVIRNPVTSIGGTARLLTKKTDDEYLVKFLNLITTEAAKIESTLDDLFSFVEEGELNLAPVQLFSLVRRSVMLFYATMKNSAIQYDLDLDEEGPTLLLDNTKMRQVFIHLVRNGIEAMPDGGNLTITTEEKEDSIEIHIIDSGIGINKAHLDKVTDPFFTTKTYGTGMGLTLVEKIITMHGASFSLAENSGGGTIAIVSLPRSLHVEQHNSPLTH